MYLRALFGTPADRAPDGFPRGASAFLLGATGVLALCCALAGVCGVSKGALNPHLGPLAIPGPLRAPGNAVASPLAVSISSSLSETLRPSDMGSSGVEQQEQSILLSSEGTQGSSRADCTVPSEH
ncbi:uncharacterized protein LOC143525768 [Brachyhypopomus gauderio]|uniref:uncharacterized protein LOC143525768 n=1 Tax=Brachyhypopomus gauderio TaxID=698409 RepID=UPI0040427451